MSRITPPVSGFQKGDAEAIQDFAMRLKAQCAQVFQDDWDMLRRFEGMARRMEQEDEKR